jgi:hypothetical protein
MVFHTSCPIRIDKLDGASKNSRCTLGVNLRRLHESPPVQPTKSPYKLIKKGFLDARTHRTALGIRQPRRRRFAISGKVATGVRLGSAGQVALVLDILEELPAAGEAVQLLNTSNGLQVWFRGPGPTAAR